LGIILQAFLVCIEAPAVVPTWKSAFGQTRRLLAAYRDVAAER
jgi:hypothetical protein